MKQADLNRAVARATGETVSTIKRLGFQLEETASGDEPNSDDLAPYQLDWDTVEAERRGSFAPSSPLNPTSKQSRFATPLQPCAS